MTQSWSKNPEAADGDILTMKETLEEWDETEPWEANEDDVESHDEDFKPYSGALPSRTDIENVLELLGVTGPTKKKAKQQRTAVLVHMFEPNTYRKLKGKLKRREASIVARKQRRKNRLRRK